MPPTDVNYVEAIDTVGINHCHRIKICRCSLSYRVLDCLVVLQGHSMTLNTNTSPDNLFVVTVSRFPQVPANESRHSILVHLFSKIMWLGQILEKPLIHGNRMAFAWKHLHKTLSNFSL
ncbi:hypothetical protein V6N12_023386 [Hibiscus sabdariffa]|uniref:Uncharacterized protein n=1 Tax=Hibiscus sabdariffa TaxID=183260 RepID=A0ABR2FXQ0_9ROSI